MSRLTPPHKFVLADFVSTYCDPDYTASSAEEASKEHAQRMNMAILGLAKEIMAQKTEEVQ